MLWLLLSLGFASLFLDSQSKWWLGGGMEPREHQNGRIEVDVKHDRLADAYDQS